jgi:D-serine deaminase-like pyridoxal phosphate-dependent protein
VSRDYAYYRDLLRGLPYPYAVVDMELLGTNARRILERSGDRPVRLASKSIRCPELLRYLLDFDPRFRGIMTYHGREVLYLLEQGFDDLLMGYPIVEPALLKAIAAWVARGRTVRLMADSPEHLHLIDVAGREAGVPLPVCLEIDLSDDYPGLRFGVWRSSIRDIPSLERVATRLKRLDYVQLDGIMGYEAQVAGVADRLPGSWLQNTVVRYLKQRAIPRAAARRCQALEYLKANGFTVKLVNGGGTGSLESTARDPSVTELTAGSGFVGGTLFDGYRDFNVAPALFYGIPVVRRPAPGVYTCHGGGYTASGAVGRDKSPSVYLPAGGRLDKNEGAGEVQTPVRFRPDPDLTLGDPVLMRYAKAGELLDHFDRLYLLDGEGQLRDVPTYRAALLGRE